MAIGTALALGIAGLATSTATQLVGAHKASSASKQAAAQQTGAVDRAQKINDDVYGPYLAQARGAATTLGRLTTPGAGARYAAPAPPPQTFGGMATPATAAPAPRGLSAAVNRMKAKNAPPSAAPPPPPTFGGMAQNGGGMVTLRAPNGSIGQVPAQLVSQYLAKGAQLVGPPPGSGDTYSQAQLGGMQ